MKYNPVLTEDDNCVYLDFRNETELRQFMDEAARELGEKEFWEFVNALFDCRPRISFFKKEIWRDHYGIFAAKLQEKLYDPA